MKKLFSVFVLVMIIFCGCLSYVASASANNLDVFDSSRQDSTESVIETEKVVYTSFEEPDALIEHVYCANGFAENDKRKEIELDIAMEANARSTNNISAAINNETTKAYIYDRMLNSIDYFDSLQATYYHIPPTGYSYYATYCIQQGESPKSKELIYNENGELVSNYSFDGTCVANINSNATSFKVDANKKTLRLGNEKSTSIQEEIKKNRMTTSVEGLLCENNILCNKLYVDIESNKELDFVSLVDSQKRIKYLPEENEDCYFYRNNLPQLPMSNTQYFSQAFAFGFLSDFERWSVDRVDEILGRECFVISGEINDDYSVKVNTNKFEMWIDKEIGALLTLEGYDHDGNLSVLLTTSEFVVDESINQDVFDDLSHI